MRSLVERKSGRRLQRTLTQLEVLCQRHSDKPVNGTEIRDRLRCVYAAALPPAWQIQVYTLSIRACIPLLFVFSNLQCIVMVYDPN